MAYITDNGDPTNNADLNFGTIAGNTDVVVTHASVILNYGNTDDPTTEIVLWTGTLARTRTFSRGDPIIMPTGAFDLNLLAGNLPDATVRAAWQALLDDRNEGAVALLGTADMTLTGKANEITDTGYSRQDIALLTGLGAAPTT